MVWALSSAETAPVAEMTVGAVVPAAPRRPVAALERVFDGPPQFLGGSVRNPATGPHSRAAVQAGVRVGPIIRIPPRVRKSGTVRVSGGARATGPRFEAPVVPADRAERSASREATTR